MKNRKWICAVIFFICSMAIAYCAYYNSIKVADGHGLYTFAMELTKGDQVRQILITVGVYAYGLVMVLALGLKGKWCYRYFLAYPIGLLNWCMLSYFVVVLGIPYTEIKMLSLILVTSAIAICCIKKNGMKVDIEQVIRSFIYILGIAMISSSGILPTYTTNDSAYYIMKYGEILAIDGGITENVSYWLTWTGIMPAFLGSLTYFCGVYSVYTLHHTLMIVFVIFFTIDSYDVLEKTVGRKIASIIAVGITFFMIITPAFYMIAHWIISNAYFMVYMFLYLWIVQKMQRGDIDERAACVLLAGISVFMALMRAESAITVCFLVLCCSMLQLKKEVLLKYMLLPIGIAQVSYWVKVYVTIGTIFSRTLSELAVIVIIIGYAISVLYVSIVRERLPQKFIEKMYALGLAGLLLLNVVMMWVRPERAAKNVDSFLHNITNEYWGFFPWLVIFVYMIFVQHRQKIVFWDFIWVGYLLFNFGICMGSGGALRYGEGDSYNRIVCATVPFIWYAIVNHIKILLDERKLKNEINYSDTML